MRNKIFSFILLRVFVLVLVIIFSVPNLSAQAFTLITHNQELNIIIDSSGSMGAKIEGKTKIQIAKDAVNALIDSLPEDAVVALRAYGSESAESLKNCQDTKLLMPMGRIDKTSYKNAVNALTPRGWTLMAYALQKAIGDFNSGEIKRNIVLVSDGEETCGGDPCKVVQDLKAQGVNAVINTIGFNVGAKAKEELSCIAGATGGKYYDANNTTELNSSLEQATKSYREALAYTATGEKISGGTGFNNATTLELDKRYSYDAAIKVGVNEKQFFFVKVPNGKMIRALVVNANTVADSCKGTIQQNFYNGLTQAEMIWQNNAMKFNNAKFLGSGGGNPISLSVDFADLYNRDSVIRPISNGEGFYFSVSLTGDKYQSYEILNKGSKCDSNLTFEIMTKSENPSIPPPVIDNSLGNTSNKQDDLQNYDNTPKFDTNVATEASSNCTLNGEKVPCGQLFSKIWKWGLGIVIILILGGVAYLLFRKKKDVYTLPPTPPPPPPPVPPMPPQQAQ